MPTDQERDDAYFAKQDADWEEQEAYEASHRPCSACDLMAYEPQHCSRCAQDGVKDDVFCEACRSVCPSCGETFCEDHAHSKTKWCDLCQQRENGPEDIITEDRWQATQ